MPKSGSTLLANYQEALLARCGRRSGQDKLKSVFGGRYVPESNLSVMLKLITINSLFGSVVVKNHWSLTQLIGLSEKFKIVRVTMCIRDPRDVILSAIDHGERSRANGLTTGGFAEHQDVSNCICWVAGLIRDLEEWAALKDVYFLKYEDLMTKPEQTLSGMAHFLGWEITEEVITEVVGHQQSIKRSSLNFNKGTTERWKHEMTGQEIAESTRVFLPFLRKMGYEH